MKRLLSILMIIAVVGAVVAAGAIVAWRIRLNDQSYYTDADSIEVPVDSADVRDVLWRPAELIPPPANAEIDDLEPRIAADGMTMYFARPSQAGDVDIWITMRNPDGWTDPVPFIAINSTFDDLGPTPSHDGRAIYFYSNRPGGLGAYDLWRMERTSEGWSEPINLSGAINSRFNDYGPSISQRGDLLYFASDRPTALIDEAAPAELNADLPEELRAERDYDLYFSANVGGTFAPAAPLVALNTSANEVTPALSPSGDFLYFASNRAGVVGGFDLFRSRRVHDEYREPEHFGPEINSASDEIAPSLDMAGFALWFSSNRMTSADSPDASEPPDHNIYRALSREVFTARTDSRIDWAEIWRAIRPSLIWLLIGLVALLALLRYLQQAQFKRLSLLAKCLLISLLVHLVVLMLMTAWTITSNVRGLLQADEGMRVALVSNSSGGESIEGQIRGALTQMQFSGAAPAPEGQRAGGAFALEQPRADMATTSVTDRPIEMGDRPTIDTTVAESMVPERAIALAREGAAKAPPVLAATSSSADVATPQDAQPSRTGEARMEIAGAGGGASAGPASQREISGPSSAPQAINVANLAPQSGAEGGDDAAENGPSFAPSAATGLRESQPGERGGIEGADTGIAAGEVPPPANVDGDIAIAGPASAATGASGGEASLEVTSSVAGGGAGEGGRAATGYATSAPSSTGAISAAPTDSIEGGGSSEESLAGASPTLREATIADDRLATSLPGNGGAPGDIAGSGVATDVTALPSDTAPASAVAAGGEEDRSLPGAIVPGDLASRANTSKGTGGGSTLGETPHLTTAPAGRGETGSDGTSLVSTDVLTSGSTPAESVGIPSGSGSSDSLPPLMATADAAIGGPQDAMGGANPNEAGEGSESGVGALTGIVQGASAQRIGLATGESSSNEPVIGAPDQFDPLESSRGGAADAPLGSGSPAFNPETRIVDTMLLAPAELGTAIAGLPSASGEADMLRLPSERAHPRENTLAQRAPEMRREILEEMGGDVETERAVDDALRWLADHQSENGRWDGNEFDVSGECGGETAAEVDVALTALALMTFLAADHTHDKPGQYQQNVRRGLDWLLEQQEPDGSLMGGETLYSHGIATIAIAEALAMSSDTILREQAGSATQFILESYSPESGGWRYAPAQYGDTSVTGWQVLALAGAKRGGIELPEDALGHVRDWMELVRHPTEPGRYAYQPGQQYTPAMTAEGMFIRQMLGVSRDDPDMQASAQFLLANRPRWSREQNSYYWYYGTLAMFHYQGDEWEQWNEALKTMLLENQRQDGCAAGSWDPNDQWSKIGSRIYQTALCALCLEVYYRYQPIYASQELISPMGTIRGEVLDKETLEPIAGATIRLDVPEGEAITVSTDGAGQYVLQAPQMPEFFALSATAQGYEPASAAASAAELRGRVMRRDFLLDPLHDDLIALEENPEVHHLGNDLFEGAINSQFQRPAEGTLWRGTFELAESVLDDDNIAAIELLILCKGVQAPNEIALNGRRIDQRLNSSPPDGSYGEFITHLEPRRLRAGENEITIETSNALGDLDDFEFVNVRVRIVRE